MEAPNPDLQLAVAYESDNPVALDLAQAALEDAGIEFTIGPPSTPEFGFTPVLNPVTKIMVAEQTAAKAREILENALPGGALNADEGEGT